MIVGLGLTLNFTGSDEQPLLFVNTKNVVPAPTVVTPPPGVAVAIFGFENAHDPPDEGDNKVEAPIQSTLSIIVPCGVGKTVINGLGADTHPAEFVNVKRTVPLLTAVTFPLLFIAATVEFELAQIPPVVDVN